MLPRVSPTITQQPSVPTPSVPDREMIEIVIQRNANNNTSLGLSIAGGIESTPFIENDTGLFISKLTSGGAAELSGKILYF